MQRPLLGTIIALTKALMDKTGTFTPEAISAMSEAFEGVLSALEIGPEDDKRREAVAKTIIELARANGAFDASTLRDAAVKRLGGLVRE